MPSVVRIFEPAEGRFVDRGERASVDLLDPGYLLGDGVFATMRSYAGVCFRAGAHLAELTRGADRLGIPLPLPRGALADEADRAAASVAGNAYVRVTLTRGVRRPTLSIIARPLEPPPAEAYDAGILAVTVTARLIPAACLDPTTKTTSYVAAVLARRDAAARGALEGLQLALDGSVAGGAMSSVFLVEGTRLVTPSLASGCRAGVTRQALLELAGASGLAAAEETVAPGRLLEADEVFFANTRIACLPVARVDDRPVGSGAFPRTRALREALHALALRETRGDAARRGDARR